MKLSPKAIFAIAIVGLLAAALLFSQYNSSRSSSSSYNLSARDMELLVSEVMPPQQQQQLASSPEQKQQLAKRLKELLALAQEAERNGFADKADVQSQVALQTDLALRDVFEKKNPGTKVEEEEMTKYLADHPTEFEQFLDANPQFKMQAQGPQAEGMKKEYAQIKVLAARAKADKLDQQESFKIRQLLERSNVLARAYVTDLQQKADKLVTDEDIEKYYNDHKQEFEEVKARHILISTEAMGAMNQEQPGAKNQDADKKPKALTKEEAKKKAEALRERALKGEEFAKLASDNSMEPGAKEKGGLLDYFTKEAMVPEFSNAAFAMQPGQISEVIETQFGFHVIKVEDRRTRQITDEETKKEIVEKVKQTKLEERIKQIAENSNIQVAEDFTVTPKPIETPQLSIPTPSPEQGSPSPAPEGKK